MDEKKRPFRLIKIFLILCLTFLFLFTSYAAYIYFSLAKISDPRECFTTSMYKIYLCPNGPNYVQFKQVPTHFIRALILGEDASFYIHKGLDWFEIKESFRRNFEEWKFARGGSTITQQLAKNLYLSKEKSVDRKIKEFFLAKQVEKFLTKTQILEKYVNVVEFGPEIFGLKNAAQYYFGKNVDSLNVLESVYLVSLLPSPVKYGSSVKDKQLSRINKSRMKIILGRLYRTKRITDEVFVYSETLMDTYAWPFPHYLGPMTEEESFEAIEQELMDELDRSDWGEAPMGQQPVTSPAEIQEDTSSNSSEDSESMPDDIPSDDNSEGEDSDLKKEIEIEASPQSTEESPANTESPLEPESFETIETEEDI